MRARRGVREGRGRPAFPPRGGFRGGGRGRGGGGGAIPPTPAGRAGGAAGVVRGVAIPATPVGAAGVGSGADAAAVAAGRMLVDVAGDGATAGGCGSCGGATSPVDAVCGGEASAPARLFAKRTPPPIA